MYLFAIGFVVGYTLSVLFEKITYHVPQFRKAIWEKPKTYFVYHVHHSLLGLLLLFFSVYVCYIGDASGLFFAGFSIASIISHTVADKRLVFIEKIT